jgi:putative oxidoreductase
MAIFLELGGMTMATFMRRFGSESYALMRIVTGLLFLWHGSQKLFGFPQASPEAPALVIYVAGAIELVGGTLVAAGLFARWAAFLCSGLMASAYWMAHGTKHLFPLVNGGELAVLYCFVFLFISANGSGVWSVDAARGGTGS